MINTKQTQNFLKLIKRLELIKNLITLEEDEEISSHILKLEEYKSNADVKRIIELLGQKAYGRAVSLIDTFISLHNQVTIFVDPETEALRFEAKSLEAEIRQISDDKTDLEKLIHEFGIRHNKELGELTLRILELRKEQSKGTIDEEETVQDYDDFYANYESTKNEKTIILNEEELKEIKDKYRKASMLCHPDVVDENQRELANDIFIELNKSYEENDLEKVSEILERLEQRKFFTSKADTANEKQILQSEVERLRMRLNELKAEFEGLQKSEAYKTIEAIADWDEYFFQSKMQLQEQLNQLSEYEK
ncbi:MAG: hypothetical protein NTX03_06050 [Bacteroidetes bacterium]|nr:hypothetical protein [Bacteroidota bacterium]